MTVRETIELAGEVVSFALVASSLTIIAVAALLLMGNLP